MKFNAIKDLDQEKWKRLAFEEAAGIYNHPSRAGGRSLYQIRTTCLMGKAPELFLMDSCGYSNDPRYCKDVVDPNLIPIEIKTTSKEQYVKHVLKRANQHARKKYREYQKVLYIFIVNGYNLDYTLHSIYKWNGKEFINERIPSSLARMCRTSD